MDCVVEQKAGIFQRAGGRDGQEQVMPQPPAHVGEQEDGGDPGGDSPQRPKGPAAVFKKGILGNYEPKEPPKSYKPGTCIYIYN